MISESNRVHLVDKRYDSDIANEQLENHLFVRLVAKGTRFTKIDFKYTIFDACYLRNCTFDSCDFTGSRFLATNFHGSTFSGCKFDYATFEKTLVDSGILETECPGYENIKMKFARTLRMNYQQLGDATGANKAMNVELQATEVHLYKAWHSNETYYRKKYVGMKRLHSLLEWCQFKALDFVWGNGESAWKLLRAAAIVLLGVAVVDVASFRPDPTLRDCMRAVIESPQVFLGTLVPSGYPHSYLTLILCTRLVMFGFFMSIIIKRLNRR
jgi:uncharacterized protein YjbI with pentapeptide repeats